MKAVAFDPHGDDPLIGCGGTLLELIDNGWEVGRIQLADGRHGSNQMDPEETAKVRKGEVEREMEYTGIGRGFFKGFEIGDRVLESLPESEKEKLIADIEKELGDYNPDVVFLPSKCDSHPQHRITYEIGKNATEGLESDPLEVEYIVWHVPFERQECDPGELEEILSVPVDGYFEDKLEGIRKHKSQVKEGRFDEMVENFNSYLALQFQTYSERKYYKAEVLGVRETASSYKSFVDSLEGVEEITGAFRGREDE